MPRGGCPPRVEEPPIASLGRPLGSAFRGRGPHPPPILHTSFDFATAAHPLAGTQRAFAQVGLAGLPDGSPARPLTRGGGPDSVTKSSKLCRIGRRGSYGVAIKRHGLTPPGRQRWRRKRCEAAFARRVDSSAKPPRSLPGRTPLEGSEEDAAGRGRTSWRKRALFWKLRPASPSADEIGEAVFPDDVWAGRSAAVPVACPREHVLAGHPAQSESGASWATPMAKTPPRHDYGRRSRRLCHRQRGP